jgi:CelD/BcsL family acetyltransferase involved in cellulose biosynthesis
MGLRVELIDDVQGLAPFVAEWDALVVARARPYCAPAWQLAWWRHARPPSALLRAVVVLDQGRLVGIVPLYCKRQSLGGWEWALLGSSIASGIEPVTEVGMEEVVAGALAEKLAGMEPRPRLLRLSQISAQSPWPTLVRDAWPGRPALLVREWSARAPTVTLDANDLDDWLAAKSRNFRAQMRRARRALEQQGARFRIATAEDLERDLAAFVRLHHARWDRRGGSVALTPGIDRALEEAAQTLAPQGRLRLSSIAVGDRTVGSLLCLAAGGQVSYWNGGYDDAFAKFRPGLVGLVEAIGHALAAGDSRFDLGPGDQQYKVRLADGADGLVTVAVAPKSVRTGAQAVLRRGRGAVAAHMTPGQKQRLRHVFDAISPTRMHLLA